MVHTAYPNPRSAGAPRRALAAAACLLALMLALVLSLMAAPGAWAQASAPAADAPRTEGAAPAPAAGKEGDGARVLQAFVRQEQAKAAASATDVTRRWVMFGLAAPLLALLLTTAALGIAMGVYGKPVYLAHMICAGLSITLAIVHAVVGVVWFNPF